MNALTGPGRLMTLMARKLIVLLCVLGFIGTGAAAVILGSGDVTGIARYVVKALLFAGLTVFILGWVLYLRWIVVFGRSRIVGNCRRDNVNP